MIGFASQSHPSEATANGRAAFRGALRASVTSTGDWSRKSPARLVNDRGVSPGSLNDKRTTRPFPAPLAESGQMGSVEIVPRTLGDRCARRVTSTDCGQQLCGIQIGKYKKAPAQRQGRPEHRIFSHRVTRSAPHNVLRHISGRTGLKAGGPVPEPRRRSTPGGKTAGRASGHRRSRWHRRRSAVADHWSSHRRMGLTTSRSRHVPR